MDQRTRAKTARELDETLFGQISGGGLMEASATRWLRAASVSDFPKDGGGCALIEGRQIALFNFSATGEWYACQNLCPHKRDNVLSRGIIGSQAGEPKVACPQHKKTFSLKTGECLSGENYAVKTYPVKVEGGDVFVGLA